MEQIIKFAKKALESMTSCAAIRATAKEFIDVPRADLKKALVDGCKLNPATVNTQIQVARKQLDSVAPAVVEAKPATNGKQDFPVAGTPEFFVKVAPKAKKAAKPAKPAAKKPAAKGKK